MTTPLGSPPKVFHEKVLGIKGNLIIIGRNVAYHNRFRRTELLLKIDPNFPEQNAGLAMEDLVKIVHLLQEYEQELLKLGIV